MGNINFNFVSMLLLTLLCFSACGVQQTNNKQTDFKKSDASQAISDSESSKETKVNSSSVTSDAGTGKIFYENFSQNRPEIAFAYHNYITGEYFTENNKKMKSASVIKLFIMEYAYHLISEGDLSPEDTISGSKVSSLIESMITVSDNNATNTLIDFFTMDKLNSYFQKNDYNDTQLGRKMLDFEAQKNGRDNFTSVKDVMRFLDNLYLNKDNAQCSEMLEILSRQKVNTKIRRDMPADIKICNKTGELSDVENDAGIVFTPNGDFAIVFMTNSTDTQNMKNAIAKTTRQIYDAICK